MKYIFNHKFPFYSWRWDNQITGTLFKSCHTYIKTEIISNKKIQTEDW